MNEVVYRMHNKLPYAYPIWSTFNSLYALLNGNVLVFSTTLLVMVKFHESMAHQFLI